MDVNMNHPFSNLTIFSNSFADSEHVTASSNLYASLDGLSVELKVAILRWLPDLSSLHALIRSSPLYHGAYTGQRRHILFEVLFRDMGSEIRSEALFAHEASGLQCENAQAWRENVESFIFRYRSLRLSPPASKQTMPELETLVSLARVYSDVLNITSEFCRSKLLVHPVTCCRLEEPHQPLSTNEKRRLYRALYRFQLFCALFHRPMIPPQGEYAPSPFDSMDISLIFLSLFNPWEIEEITCVRDYMVDRYAVIFKECLDEILLLCPSKDLRLKSILMLQVHDHCMSMGLQFFRRLINTSSIKDKAQILEPHSIDLLSSLSMSLNVEPYDYMFPTDTNRAYIEGAKLQFQDDEIDGPNAAWPWSTGFKVDVWYADSRKESLRKWGYVMWDVERLERWGILTMDAQEMMDKKYSAIHE